MLSILKFKCKILWGYDLRELKSSKPDILINKEWNFEKNYSKTKFPENAGETFIDFLGTIKTTKTSTIDLKNLLKLGLRAKLSRC